MTSNLFNMYKAKPTFAERKEPGDASEYIANKKTKYTFCNPNVCHPNKNIYSQGNLMMLRRANKLAFYPCVNEFDKTQLYLNLFTTLQLESDTKVLEYYSTSTPNYIEPNVLDPYNYYNIDPSGELFGNTICGLNNWENFIRPDISFYISGTYSITSNNDYNTIIDFTGNGVFRLLVGTHINYIVVGGGGGGAGGACGGTNGGGGGGGGGVSTGFFTASNTYNVYIGSGGLGGTKEINCTSNDQENGENGGSSEISGVISVSGGFGGIKPGVSTGGASGNGGAGGAPGFPGGNGTNGGGGGGGAYPYGIGGNGSISSTSVYLYGTDFGAGGAGGGGLANGGSGGNSYAGTGGIGSQDGGSAVASYGGGGAGGNTGNGGGNSSGGNGGSGRVILYFNR